METNDDLSLKDKVLQNNNFKVVVGNEIHYYNNTFGLFIHKISSIVKIWMGIYTVSHFVFVFFYLKFYTEIPDDGIMVVLPPFINMVIAELFYFLPQIFIVLAKCNGDVIYIQRYYTELAKKLWLPDGQNGFAWLKFCNYGYMEPDKDAFIDDIVENTSIRFKTPIMIMLWTFALTLMSMIILVIHAG
jgi:hypothetical protein